MNPKILEEIGLTPGEAKVYLALLRIGQSSTGAIAKESQVSRSKLYIILDKLAKKGLIGHLVKGKIVYFKAMEPQRILDYMEEKSNLFNQQKEEIKKMLPRLALEQKHGKRETDATLYEGFNSIKNFYLNLLGELRSGDTYYVLGASYGELRSWEKEFFERYHKKRVQKKIHVKMLANHDLKDRLVQSTLLNSDIKFLPKYLLSNMIVIFYNSKSFLFFLSEEPISLLIEDKEITKGFKSYFDTFWRLAKR